MSWAEIIAAAALAVSVASAAFTFFAPLRTERLKTEAAQKDRELNLFTILMSERGRWGTPQMLAALNAAKVVFRGNDEIMDKWFICYSNVGGPDGKESHFNDLLAEIGKHVGIPMRREDLDNYFVNPHEQRETAVRTEQVKRAFSELSSNTGSTAV